MRAEWRTLCAADDMRIRGKRIMVSFANERSHGVQVLDEGDSYLLTAVVADGHDLDPNEEPQLGKG
ncbi:hypothetical protein AB0M35_28005 [Micromonospora sp. NPDC051196]|uniref:hypothetical protein n=1 Tax=Micromonospora sp. NPDC051196 TaxID=3155281 RepID=UPI0034180D38